MNKTVQYYNDNLESLIELYANADMHELYNIITDTIPSGSSLLDIGFGTGRDIKQLIQLGYDVWGVDPSEKFVEHVKNRFTLQREKFALQALPFENNKCLFDQRFDAVLLIAVLMHIKPSSYPNVIQSLINTLKLSKSTLVISYSTGKRVDDDRTFHEVDIEYFSDLLLEHGFKEYYTSTADDSLQRDQIQWITKVYKHD